MDEHVIEQPTFAGQLIARRYHLQRVLAQGAICRVFAGEDTMLRRPIAVKLVPPEQVAAFRAALRATATISHPAAVLVLDAVEQDGAYFVVQEYIRGNSLATQLGRGLTSERAVTLGLQLARLIAYAHQCGITHGDLTPNAVLIEPDGTAHVNNFCLPADVRYFEQYVGVEKQLARGLGGAVTAEPGPPLELNTPATDVRAIGLLLAQALTTSSPSGGVRTFGADVPAAVRELVERLVIRSHPHAFAEIQAVRQELEATRATLSQWHADERQDTPPSVRRYRDYVGQAAPWSNADTQLNIGPSRGPMPPGSGGLGGRDLPPAARGYTQRRPSVPLGPFDGPGMPEVLPEGDGIEQQLTEPTPLPLGPAAMAEGAWPRPGSLSGPLRPLGQSGPLRPLSQSGPLRMPPQSGPVSTPGPTGKLRQPAMAPPPQRAPGPSGPLRRPPPTSAPRIPSMSAPRIPSVSAPIPAYRVPSAIPWSDEPQVQQWVESASSRPLGRPSRPMAQPSAMGIATLLLIGLLLAAICFVIGYYTPFLIPFH